MICVIRCVSFTVIANRAMHTWHDRLPVLPSILTTSVPPGCEDREVSPVSMGRGTPTSCGSFIDHFPLCYHLQYVFRTGLEEHVIWDRDISEKVSALPMDMQDWHDGFSETFNNAIEHAEGSQIAAWINGTAAGTEMMISDDGYGVFRKIKHAPDCLMSALQYGNLRKRS